jgi:hypothetical protein
MGAHDQTIAVARCALAMAGGDIVLHAQANRYLGRAYAAQGDSRRAIDCLGQTAAPIEGAWPYERPSSFSQTPVPRLSTLESP